MERKRNFVIESAMTAAIRLKDNATADKMDELTDQKITRLEYMVIFLNDQLYSGVMELEDLMKKGGMMKFEGKFHFKEIKRIIDQYNSRIEKMSPNFIELIADVTASMEEDIYPHLEKYKFQVSQLLLDNEIYGYPNQALSLIETMLLIRSIAASNIDAIKEMYYKYTMQAGHYTDCLSLSQIETPLKRLSNVIASRVVERGTSFDFSRNENVITAFKVILNKLYDAKVYNKAFEKWS